MGANQGVAVVCIAAKWGGLYIVVPRDLSWSIVAVRQRVAEQSVRLVYFCFPARCTCSIRAMSAV